MAVESGWMQQSGLARAARATGGALLVGLSSGCLTQYSQYDAGPGRRGYHITCGNSFERCRAKANDLCPNGYERVRSSKRSKLDMPELFVKTENEYTFDVECERR